MARETSEQREERRRAHAAKVTAGQHQEAMSELVILHPLPFDSRKRVLRWLGDRLDNFADPARDFDAYSDEPPF